MKTLCVTSMTSNHYTGIGGFMIDSWKKYWFEFSNLLIYAEGFNIKSQDNIIIENWEERCKKDWNEFCLKESDINSRRFAKKGFSFLDALVKNKENYDRIIWLDADLLFKKPISENMIHNLLPEKKLIALFDCYYQINPNYSEEEYENLCLRSKFGAESGFVIVNTKHTLCNTYVDNYRSLYTSDTKHSSLTSWFDGEVVLSAARNFLNEVEDLSKLRTTNKTQTPLNRSSLSDYMVHVKAKVKKSLTNDDFKRITNATS